MLEFVIQILPGVAISLLLITVVFPYLWLKILSIIVCAAAAVGCFFFSPVTIPTMAIGVILLLIAASQVYYLKSGR